MVSKSDSKGDQFMLRKTVKNRITLRGAIDSLVDFLFHRNKTKNAFTLAEVLVTLAVLGVIASLVIGKVIPNVQEKILVSKLKKVYSQLNSSFDVAVKLYGPPQYWNLEESVLSTDKETGLTIGKYPAAKRQLFVLLSGLKVEDVENKAEPYEQFSLHGSDFTGNGIVQPLFQTSDGVIFSSKSYIGSSTCDLNVSTTNSVLQNICGEIKLDLNGSKPPNRYGIDNHVFYFTKRGIVPVGTKDENQHTSAKNLSLHCSKDSIHRLNGFACSAWIIYKGNMDYLRKTVSWD